LIAARTPSLCWKYTVFPSGVKVGAVSINGSEIIRGANTFAAGAEVSAIELLIPPSKEVGSAIAKAVRRREKKRKPAVQVMTIKS
jgi:hypothetical protein